VLVLCVMLANGLRNHMSGLTEATQWHKARTAAAVSNWQFPAGRTDGGGSRELAPLPTWLRQATRVHANGLTSVPALRLRAGPPSRPAFL
jgi:hypothetical protein